MVIIIIYLLPLQQVINPTYISPTSALPTTHGLPAVMNRSYVAPGRKLHQNLCALLSSQSTNYLLLGHHSRIYYFGLGSHLCPTMYLCVCIYIYIETWACCIVGNLFECATLGLQSCSYVQKDTQNRIYYHKYLTTLLHLLVLRFLHVASCVKYRLILTYQKNI